jgi:putative transposase
MRERKPNRHPSFDYNQNCPYLITICTHDRTSFFGEIDNDVMILNSLGIIAENCLIDIPKHFDYVRIDKFIVMPDHVHAILTIKDYIANENLFDSNMGVGNCDRNSLPYHKNDIYKNYRMRTGIPMVINQYKSTVTRLIRKQLNIRNFSWQKSYHDHIIRSQSEFESMCYYIDNNPINWSIDYDKID